MYDNERRYSNATNSKPMSSMKPSTGPSYADVYSISIDNYF